MEEPGSGLGSTHGGWAEEHGGFMSEGLIPSLLEPTVLQHECGNVQIPLWQSLQHSHTQISDCIAAVVRRGCWIKSDSEWKTLRSARPLRSGRSLQD